MKYIFILFAFCLIASEETELEKNMVEAEIIERLSEDDQLIPDDLPRFCYEQTSPVL